MKRQPPPIKPRTGPKPKPPVRQVGQGVGPRAINGEILGIREAALFIGYPVKKLRHLVARRLIPSLKRTGWQIEFSKRALQLWIDSRADVSVDEALRNWRRWHPEAPSIGESGPPSPIQFPTGGAA